MSTTLLLAASGAEALPIFIVVVVVMIGLSLVFRLGAGSMDDGRIREHIEQAGGQVRSIDWAPFGQGWFGSKNERIYEVVYEDAASNVHRAYCKTSALAGVYWTEDTIIEPAKTQATDSTAGAKDLAEENRRLREEIERLKSSRES